MADGASLKLFSLGSLLHYVLPHPRVLCGRPLSACPTKHHSPLRPECLCQHQTDYVCGFPPLRGWPLCFTANQADLHAARPGSGRVSQLPWMNAAPSSPCLLCSIRRLSRCGPGELLELLLVGGAETGQAGRTYTVV